MRGNEESMNTNYAARAQRGASFHLTVMQAIVGSFTKILYPLHIPGASTIASCAERVLRGNGSRTAAQLTDDAWFVYPTYDAYWCYYILGHKLYEEPLHHLFRSLRTLDFTFLDCGANYGYWSCLLTSRAYGGHPGVAIEASESTFRILRANASLNGDRFLCLQNAVSSSSGQDLMFADHGPRQGRHVVRAKDPRRSGKTPVAVESISLDDVCERYLDRNHERRFVIKLDVEGSEIDVLMGAGSFLRRRSLFVYEDLATDARSEVTRYLMGKDFHIFYAHQDGRIERIHKIDRVSAIKHSSSVGYRCIAYNFLAVQREGAFRNALWSLAS